MGAVMCEKIGAFLRSRMFWVGRGRIYFMGKLAALGKVFANSL